MRSLQSHHADLHQFMTAEHARLDELLAQAAGRRGAFDKEAYQRFREGLLRHIRIEERILLPMAERKRGGAALPLAARLRLEHGALAALVMLAPVAHAVRAIRAVLDAHNPLEEIEGGVYEQCESLAGPEIAELMIRADTPRVPVSSWVDSPKVLAAAKRVLARAGHDPVLLGPYEGECQ